MSSNEPLPPNPEDPPARAPHHPPGEDGATGPAGEVAAYPPPPYPGYWPAPRPAPPLFTRPHPNFWWAILWCFGFLLVTQVPALIVSTLVLVGIMVLAPGSIPPEVASNPEAFLQTPAGTWSMAAAFLTDKGLEIAVSLLVIRLVVGPDWTRKLALRSPGAAHLALALAGLPAMVLLGDGAYYVLRHVLHLPSLLELLGLPGGMEGMITKVFSGWPWPLAVLLVGVGPGVAEELWCRGFLGRGLVGRHGYVLGVLFTSFFFGLIHMDPPQGTMAMLMGLWLHFVYLTTRSLWVPMLLHFLNNSLAVTAPRIPALSALEESPGTLPWYLFAAAGLLLLAVGWALYQGRARLAPEAPGKPVLWRPPGPGVEYPPPGSGVVVVRPRPSPAALAGVALGLLALAGSIALVAAR